MPAGKFKAIRAHITMKGKDRQVETSYWFVKDVGFVKQTINAEGLNIVLGAGAIRPGQVGAEKRKAEESSTK